MAARACRPQAGFTYLGLIIFVTVIGMVGAATLKVSSLLRRAEAENELLEIGAEFSAALRSYAAATPQGQSNQPTSLEQLLRDPRFPNPRRHLRRILVDPTTGKAEWGMVSAGEGAPILGVYSRSQAQPLKIANFDPRFVNFENKKHLSDWKFTANGRGVLLAPATAMPGTAAPPVAAKEPLWPGLLPAPAAGPIEERQLLSEPAAQPKRDAPKQDAVEEDTPPAPSEPVEEEEKDPTSEPTPASVPTDQ
jgi:type II secretory pathway pseudopilin PulG